MFLASSRLCPIVVPDWDGLKVKPKESQLASYQPERRTTREPLSPKGFALVKHMVRKKKISLQIAKMPFRMGGPVELSQTKSHPSSQPLTTAAMTRNAKGLNVLDRSTGLGRLVENGPHMGASL